MLELVVVRLVPTSLVAEQSESMPIILPERFAVTNRIGNEVRDLRFHGVIPTHADWAPVDPFLSVLDTQSRMMETDFLVDRIHGIGVAEQCRLGHCSGEVALQLVEIVLHTGAVV